MASLFLVAPYRADRRWRWASSLLRHRPAYARVAETDRPILIGETLGLAAYLQGDVLLLGWLTNDTIVGYYAHLHVTVGIAVVAVGQSFGMSYNHTLRGW